MTHSADPPPLPAVVLAAGRSVRMGKPKAFLHAGGGETFLGRILRTLQASARPLLVVGSSDWTADRPELIAAGATLVVNPHPERGQLSSLQCGLVAVPRSKAVLVALVDVPFVAPDTITTLLRIWYDTRADVVRPANESRHGHPIVIGPSVVADLLNASPENTTRTVLAFYAATTENVFTSDPGPFTDIDTPEEYERVTGLRF